MALVIGALVMAPSLVPQEKWTAAFAKNFFKQTGWALRLDGRSTFKLLPSPVLEVENVGIAGASATNGLEFAQSERMVLGLGWLSILQAEPGIDYVILEKPRFDLQVDEDGTRSWAPSVSTGEETSGTSSGFNLTQLFTPLQTAGAVELRVVQGELSYQNKKTKADVSLTNLDALLLSAGHGGDLTLEGQVTSQDIPYRFEGRLGSLAAFFEKRPSSVDLAVSVANEAEAAAQGQVTWAGAPLGNLALSVEVSKPEAFFTRIGHPVSPELEPVAVTGRASLQEKGLELRDVRLQAGELMLEGTANWERGDKQNQLTAKVNGASIPFQTLLQMLGAQNLAAGEGEVSLTLSAQGQSLEALARDLNIEGTARVKDAKLEQIKLPDALARKDDGETLEALGLDVTFSGDGSSAVVTGEANWRGEPLELSGTVTDGFVVSLKAANPRFSAGYSTGEQSGYTLSFETEQFVKFAKWYGLELPEVLQDNKLSASGTFSQQDEELQVKELSVFLGDTRLEGDIHVTQEATPLLKGELAMSGLSVDGTFLNGQGEDGQNSTGIPLDLSHLNIDLNLDLQDLRIGDLAVDSATLYAHSKDERLYWDFKQASLYGGAASGRIVTHLEQGMPALEADISLRSVNADPFLASISNLPRVEGTLNAVVDVASKGDTQARLWGNAEGALSFRLDNGRLHSLDLDQMARTLKVSAIKGWPLSDGASTPFVTWGAEVTFTQGKAQFNGLSLQSNQSLIEGRGAIDLKDGTVDWKLVPSFIEKTNLPIDSDKVQFGPQETPVQVAGGLSLPDFSVGEKTGEDTASLSSSRSKAGKEVSKRLAEQLSAQKLARKLKTQPVDANDGETQTASIRAKVSNAAESVAVAETSLPPMVPKNKPEGMATISAAPLNIVQARKSLLQRQRDAEFSSGEIDIDDVISGKADDASVLESIEKGWGMNPGDLSGE